MVGYSLNLNSKKNSDSLGEGDDVLAAADGLSPLDGFVCGRYRDGTGLIYPVSQG